MDPQLIAADVTAYLSRIYTTHLMQVLTTTIIIYDIFTTFDREYHYVWRTRWSYAKFIFFVNRYLAPFIFFCIRTGWFFGMACAVVMTIVSSVLVTRVWAVYERDRRVLAFLITVFIAMFVPTWVVSFRGFSQKMTEQDTNTLIHIFAYLGMARAEGPKAVEQAWPLTRCYFSHFPRTYPAVMVTSLVYESSVFTAMAYKMVQEKKKTRLIEAFYRDGVIYYLVMFSCLLSAAVCGFAYDNNIAQGIMGSAYFIGIKSMMCSHIILRLRSYFSHGDPLVDGRENDPFAPEHAGNIDSTHGMVSTIINFARMEALGGPDGDEPETFSHLEHRHRRQPRDREAAIPLENTDTLEHDVSGAKLQKWDTDEKNPRTSTSGGQASIVPSSSDSEPSVDWTHQSGPRPRRSGQEDLRCQSKRNSPAARSSESPLEAVAVGQRPSVDRPTVAIEQVTYPPSGRMSLQGSSATHLELEELTLAGSREPRRPSLGRRSAEPAEGDVGVSQSNPPQL
ncbi:hypothetical protein FRB90_006803 [Tulasnella sp. 427]|nr:hypothetical protein FRB90_006803 [Tulasnella sp. 427]